MRVVVFLFSPFFLSNCGSRRHRSPFLLSFQSPWLRYWTLRSLVISFPFVFSFAAYLHCNGLCFSPKCCRFFDAFPDPLIFMWRTDFTSCALFLLMALPSFFFCLLFLCCSVLKLIRPQPILFSPTSSDIGLLGRFFFLPFGLLMSHQVLCFLQSLQPGDDTSFKFGAGWAGGAVGPRFLWVV